MNIYSTQGMRNVHAESFETAAGVFAARLARRENGRKGIVRTLRQDSYTPGEGGVTSATYNAFIGVHRREFGQVVTVGNNVSFTVYREATE